MSDIPDGEYAALVEDVTLANGSGTTPTLIWTFRIRGGCYSAFVNLIWPLLMLSFGPTWPLFRLPVQTPLLDPLPESTHGSFLGGSRPQRSPARP